MNPYIWKIFGEFFWFTEYFARNVHHAECLILSDIKKNHHDPNAITDNSYHKIPYSHNSPSVITRVINHLRLMLFAIHSKPW